MADRSTIGFTGGVAWTPSDTARIPGATRGFQVATAGNVALEYSNGDVTVWPACAAGIAHPHWGFVRIRATGTTATGIVVGY